MKFEKFEFLVFSDLHAHPHTKYSNISAEGWNSRLQTALDVLRQILRYAVKHEIRYVLFCGDLFDAKHKIPATAIVALSAEFESWKSADLRLIMIPGNHDLLERSGRTHALSIFKFAPFFVGNQSCLPIGNSDVFVYCVPFAEQFNEAMFEFPASSSVESRGFYICLAHGVVEGSILGTSSYPVGQMESGTQGIIPRHWLAPFDLSIVGHIHFAQQFHGGSGPILVPGSPYQMHPHESLLQRGFWHICISEERQVSMRMINTEVPCFVHFNLDEQTGLQVDTEKNLINEATGNICILHTSSSISPALVVQAQESLTSRGAIFVEIVPEPVSVESATRYTFTERMTPIDIFKTVLHSGIVDLSSSELRLEEIEEKGVSYLQLAQDIESLDSKLL